MLNHPGEMKYSSSPLLNLPNTCFLCLWKQPRSACSMLTFIFTPRWAFVHPRPPVSMSCMWLRRSPAQHLCVLHAHASWLHTPECPGCEQFPLRPLWDVSACSRSVVSTVGLWGVLQSAAAGVMEELDTVVKPTSKGLLCCHLIQSFVFIFRGPYMISD